MRRVAETARRAETHTGFMKRPGGSEPNLARFAFRPLLTHRFDALDHELQTISSPFRTRNCLLEIEERFGIVQFLAQFLDERMDFGVDQKQLTTETWLQKQLFVQHPLQDKARNDPPVAADLPQPVVLLCAHGPRNF